MDTLDILITLGKIVAIFGFLILGAAISVYLERRVSAFIQDRVGPNRVGPFGLLQPFADVLKLVMKEDIVPKNAHPFIHNLAPILAIAIALTTFAVVPFGNTIELFGRQVKLMVADVNIGLLYVLAMTSVGVYGISLAGWSSNNKYSLLGGLRSSAQMISYELSMGLSIIGVLMIAGTLRLDQIVLKQVETTWNIFLQPVGFITFLIAAFAETNRLPFDLPEAEPELVGGYHTEYTGMKFGLFFLAEYANMITSSAIVATLFLGGWHVPFIDGLGIDPFWLSLIQVGGFVAKVVILVLFFIVVRWTIPRFRYDQLMNLGWKVMLPLAIANTLVTGIVLLLFA
ncbi:MAG: NADH-quinone oxidoreductase subunit NuoH [Bacteroidetes bacterium]|jgi:NADH-quinone oxidoreductase subunit H|nr:NADH-quinone oxidoreductase subunit NuoH [Bacteroidota bacterium]